MPMKTTALLLCLLALGGCNGKPPEPKAQPPVATPFDPLLKDKQRAADVQKTVDQQAEEQRKQIEAAEQ